MKRVRPYAGQGTRRAAKRRRIAGAYTGTSTFSRSGYKTVARTRGVYAKGEMKYFDSVREIVAIPSTTTWAGTVLDPNVYPVANMNCLFAPTNGAGISQRIGKACKVVKIKITGLVTTPNQVNQVAADAACMIRILLVQDMQTNATQMTGTQLMTSPGVASVALAPLTHQNVDNFGRFRVLKDKKILIQDPNMAWDGTNIEQGGQLRQFKMNYKCRVPINVRFNATNGGTVADIVDHSFHVLAISSNADLTPYLSYACRVCFKE